MKKAYYGNIKYYYNIFFYLQGNLQYRKFQNNKLLRTMCDEKGLDSTYGLMGNAAPWYDESMSNILANGGAGQINTPVPGNVLKQLGILKER